MAVAVTAAACKVPMREKLPPSIAPVGDLLGARPLLRLIEAYGGTRLYVPAATEDFDRLSTLLGTKPAKRLVRAYGRDTIKVPLCKAWRVHLLRAEGLTHAAIALRLGMHEHSVMRLLSQNERQRAEQAAQLRFQFG